MSSSPTVHLLDSSRATGGDPSAEHSELALRCDSAPQYLCRACRHAVAAAADRIEVAGATLHVCTNPAGITFRVLCFSSAPGAIRAGTPTLEHTFFPPFAWSFGLCRHCSAHLGWHYSAIGAAGFWGLIGSQLALADGSTGPIR